jgi:hypothetical protein
MNLSYNACECVVKTSAEGIAGSPYGSGIFKFLGKAEPALQPGLFQYHAQ